MSRCFDEERPIYSTSPNADNEIDALTPASEMTRHQRQCSSLAVFADKPILHCFLRLDAPSALSHLLVKPRVQGDILLQVGFDLSYDGDTTACRLVSWRILSQKHSSKSGSSMKRVKIYYQGGRMGLGVV